MFQKEDGRLMLYNTWKWISSKQWHNSIFKDLAVSWTWSPDHLLEQASCCPPENNRHFTDTPYAKSYRGGYIWITHKEKTECMQIIYFCCFIRHEVTQFCSCCFKSQVYIATDFWFLHFIRKVYKNIHRIFMIILQVLELLASFEPSKQNNTFRWNERSKISSSQIPIT